MSGLTRAIVNLQVLSQNIKNIKASLAPNVKMLTVIKANAYGLGSVECASAALDAGADMLAVAIPLEGATLRDAGISAPILVLGSTDEKNAQLSVEHELEQEVCTIKILEAIQKKAAELKKIAKIHLKIDSGMNRIGICSHDELHLFLEHLEKCKNVELAGVFTHFACADDESEEPTHIQAKRFEEAVAIIKRSGRRPIVHAANSAATLRFKQYHYDMVRPGIILYGCYPSKYVPTDVKICCPMTWVTKITHIKTVSKGDSISYGWTHTLDEPRKIATLGVGYGDGYMRIMSGKAEVLVRRQRAKQVGRICMDQCMIDVTAVTGVSVGDEVILMGESGFDCISADMLASWAQTISYEILLSISGRVSREYLR